ncbi:MAG: DUF2020 domain-containing protein [Mycobacteriales bacterium]
MLTLGLVAAAVAGAAGCGSPVGDETAAPPGNAATAGTPPAATTTKPRPTATPMAVTVDGPCPYVDRETMAETVGQHIARTTLTSTRPHAGCGFYRPNGEQAVDIAVSVLASPSAAQARAIAMAGPAANPVDGVGDGGAVAITDTGALLGVSEGRALVVVRINQRSSLEAVEIARMVVAKL